MLDDSKAAASTAAGSDEAHGENQVDLNEVPRLGHVKIVCFNLAGIVVACAYLSNVPPSEDHASNQPGQASAAEGARDQSHGDLNGRRSGDCLHDLHHRQNEPDQADDEPELEPLGELLGDIVIELSNFHERAIYLAHDQFYAGTCEADLICAEGGTAAPEAKSCDNGFVCDEKTSLDEGRKYPCAAGYVCDVATTPDTKLHAPSNQLKQLCREGFYCEAGSGTKDKFKPCPENWFCPTGTANRKSFLFHSHSLLRICNFTHHST